MGNLFKTSTPPDTTFEQRRLDSIKAAAMADIQTMSAADYKPCDATNTVLTRWEQESQAVVLSLKNKRSIYE